MYRQHDCHMKHTTVYEPTQGRARLILKKTRNNPLLGITKWGNIRRYPGPHRFRYPGVICHCQQLEQQRGQQHVSCCQLLET